VTIASRFVFPRSFYLDSQSGLSIEVLAKDKEGSTGRSTVPERNRTGGVDR